MDLRSRRVRGSHIHSLPGRAKWGHHRGHCTAVVSLGSGNRGKLVGPVSHALMGGLMPRSIFSCAQQGNPFFFAPNARGPTLL
jgi:hypothetical protein